MIGGSGDGRIDKAEKTPREVRAILEQAAAVLTGRMTDSRHRKVCDVGTVIRSAINILSSQRLEIKGEHKKIVLERVEHIAEENGISPESLTAIPLDEARRLIILTLRSLKR